MKKTQKETKEAIFTDGKVNLHVKGSFFSHFPFFDGLSVKWSIIRKNWTIRFCVFLVLFIGLPSLLAHLNYTYQDNRILWNTTIMNIPFGGLSKQEALEKLNQLTDHYLKQKITFNVDGSLYGLEAKDLGIKYNDAEVIERATFRKDQEDYRTGLIRSTRSLFVPRSFKLTSSVDKTVLRDSLIKNVWELSEVKQEPKVALIDNNFISVSGISGKTLDFDEVKGILKNNADTFSISLVTLKLQEDPTIFDPSYIASSLAKANDWSNKQIQITNQESSQKFNLDLGLNKAMIRFSYLFNPKSLKEEPVIDLDPILLQEYLENEIKDKVKVDKEDTTLSLNEEKIVASGIVRNGITLDTKKTSDYIRSTFQDSSLPVHKTTLVLNYESGKIIQPEGINTGITQLTSYGESDFAGSPVNRIHNIKTALTHFQNLIVMPGEEFSFNQHLGVVDGATGYKKELVIKEGGTQTIPEYGGGVCQVSTTVYRASLYGGFSISKRRSHSYKVQYYNPDGLDATVYPPAQDFKFINNYDFPILIQNIIDEENKKVKFYFYGGDRNNTVELLGPYRSNFRPKPEEVVTIYNPDMPEGYQKKSSGHNGFIATWTRKIHLEDKIIEEKFVSNYKAVPDKLEVGGSQPPSAAVTEEELNEKIEENEI